VTDPLIATTARTHDADCGRATRTTAPDSTPSSPSATWTA